MANASAPLRSALVLLCAGAMGGLVAVQSRINGEFATQIGDSYLTALFSFASGLLILCAFLLCSPQARRGLSRVLAAVRRGELPLWMLAGGPLGAFFAFNQGALTPLIGVASFTVGVVGGLVLGGVIVDRRGLGPAGRIGLTRQRLIGTVLVLLGATLACLPELRLGWSSLLVLVSLPVGAGSALQSALNGRVAVAGSSVAAATLINFVTGTLLLAVGAGVSVAVRGWPANLPDSPLLYSAGVMGVVVIAVISLLVRFGGVLLVGMSNVAGQLIGSVLVDFLAPFGERPTVLLLVGAGIALVAVVIAALPGGTMMRRRPG